MREEATHTERKERIANSPKQSEKGGGGGEAGKKSSFPLLQPHACSLLRPFPASFFFLSPPGFIKPEKGEGEDET